MSQKGVNDLGQLPRASVTCHCTLQPRQALPVDVRYYVGSVFVSAYQYQSITGVRVGDWYASIGRCSDRCWNAWYQFTWDTLLVEKRCFFCTTVEYKRVSTLQPDDLVPFPNLLREQDTNGVLFDRLCE